MIPKKPFPLFFIFLFMSSCAFHSGVVTSGNASVSSENFRVAGFGYGFAKTVHVFGIGGLNKYALVMDAKKDMAIRYPLKQGQMFGQTTIDYRRLYVLPFVVKTSVYISSDIIDFNTERLDSTSEDYSNYGGHYLFIEPEIVNTDKVMAPENLVKNENYKYPNDGTGPLVKFRVSPTSYGEGELFNDDNGLLEIRSQNLSGKVNTVLKSKYELLELDEEGNIKN